LTIKLYLQSTKNGNYFGKLDLNEPSSETLITGWITSTYSAPRYGRMVWGIKNYALYSTVYPTNNFSVDGYQYEEAVCYGPFSGELNGTINFSFELIATTGGTQDGRLRIKLWKGSTSDGLNSTQITGTSETILTTQTTNLTTTPQIVTASYNVSNLDFNGEYLFLVIAYETTGAGNNTNCDAMLRIGTNNYVEVPLEVHNDILSPNDSLHTLSSTSPSVYNNLVISDCLHTVDSDTINFEDMFVLDGIHYHFADTILGLSSITPQDVDLNPNNSYHNHHSDYVGFPREYVYKILWNGKDISTEVVDYTRNIHICNGIGTLTLSIKGTSTTNFIPWSVIELYENDIKKGRYYVSSVEKIKPGLMTVLSCQDETKKLQDYFISENHIVDFPSRTRYWLEKFLDEATVDYVFDTDGLGEPISNNTSFGMTFALDEVTRLCQQSGWYFYADGYGTIHIGKLEVDTNSYKAILNDYTAESLSVNKNDRMLRNRVIVWGSASFTYDKWIFAEESTITPYNYDLADIRTAVLSNSNIESIGFAQTLATRILKETEKITEVKTVNVIGYIDLTVGDTVYVNSRFYKGTGIVTTINANVSTNGVITTIIIDERCPRLYGYFDLGGYVYIGTEGNGVWRKPLKWEHTWENYSTGITDLNIQDLAINNGLFACVTYTGDLYTRTLWDAGWSKVSATGFMDVTPSGITYSGIPVSGYFTFDEVECKAVTINQANNEIMAVFNTRGSTFWSGGLVWPSGVQRSWLYTSPGEGNYTVVPITISGEELDYEITAYDLDTNQNYPVISVMKTVEVEHFHVDGKYLGISSTVNGQVPESNFNVLPSNSDPDIIEISEYSTREYPLDINIVIERHEAIGYYGNNPYTGVNLGYVEKTGSNMLFYYYKEYYNPTFNSYNYHKVKEVALELNDDFSGYIYSTDLSNEAFFIADKSGTFRRYHINVFNGTCSSSTLFTLDPSWEYTLIDKTSINENLFLLYRARRGLWEEVLPVDYYYKGVLIKVDMKTGLYTIVDTGSLTVTYDVLNTGGYLESTPDGFSLVASTRPSIQVFNNHGVVILFYRRNYQIDYYILDTASGVTIEELYHDPNLIYVGAQSDSFECSLSGMVDNYKSYLFSEYRFVGGTIIYNGTHRDITLRAYVSMDLSTRNVNVEVFRKIQGAFDEISDLDIHTWGRVNRQLVSKYLGRGGILSIVGNNSIELRNPLDGSLERTYTLSSEWTLVDIVITADDIEDCFYVIAKNANKSPTINRIVGIDFNSGEIIKWFSSTSIYSLGYVWPEQSYYYLSSDILFVRQANSIYGYRFLGLVQKSTRKGFGYALIRHIENEFEEVAYPSSPLKVECSKTYPFLAYGGFSGYGSNMGYLYASALGERGNWLNLNLIPDNYFVHDGRVLDIITESGNSRCIIVASETQTSGESSIKLFDINHTLSSGWDQGGTITFSGIEAEGETIDVVFSGYPISSIYYSTVFYSFSGYVTRLETTNYQDHPYIFATLSGEKPTFYQKDSYYFGEADTPFIDRTNNMPSGFVTIIRTDDRI
jgi:hypothetical protein